MFSILFRMTRPTFHFNLFFRNSLFNLLSQRCCESQKDARRSGLESLFYILTLSSPKDYRAEILKLMFKIRFDLLQFTTDIQSWCQQKRLYAKLYFSFLFKIAHWHYTWMPIPSIFTNVCAIDYVDLSSFFSRL